MKLKEAHLFTMAKVAGITTPLPDEEQHKGPPGKAFVSKVRDIGGKAFGVGAMAVGGVASLGKVQPLQKLNPRY